MLLPCGCVCADTDDKPRERDNGVENMCVPVSLQYRTGEVEEGVMITKVGVCPCVDS
jgi:hypothetical protein